MKDNVVYVDDEDIALQYMLKCEKLLYDDIQILSPLLRIEENLEENKNFMYIDEKVLNKYRKIISSRDKKDLIKLIIGWWAMSTRMYYLLSEEEKANFNGKLY